MLDFLLLRFPDIPGDVWRERCQDGRVTGNGLRIAPDTPYAAGLDVHYWREVAEEPPVRTDFRVVSRDAHLLVVDKPPFLPVTPGGSYVRACLLTLVEERLGLDGVAPLHRLDADTSGLVVLSLEPASRGHFSGLFQGAGPRLAREYLAVCELLPGARPQDGTLRHHLARDPGRHWLQRVVPGRPPNSFTAVEVLAHDGRRALLCLRPLGGRKHQLRAQLADAGMPVVGDRLYGRDAPRERDLARPLFLVCSRLAVDGFPAFGFGPPLGVEWRTQRRPWDPQRLPDRWPRP